MSRVIAALTCVSVVVSPLLAQSEQEFRSVAAEVIDETIGNGIDAMVVDPSDPDLRADISDRFTLLLTLIVDRIRRVGSRQLAERWRFRRADVQTGATTSAVLNPLLPASFGIAMESGSLTRTISGNTVSIKVNPAGLFCSSTPEGADSALRMDGCLDTWRRVGLSVSFDTNRGKANAVTGIAPLSDQFSEAALRVSLFNHRDPQSRAFQDRLGDWRQEAQAYANQLNTASIRWQSFSDRAAAILDTAVALSTQGERGSAARDGLADLLWEAYSGLEDADYADLTRVAETWAAASASDRDLYYGYAHGLVMSFEYALQRPDVATEAIGSVVPAGIRPPSLHTSRLLIARGFPTRSLDFNFNLSASWFAETRPGMSGNLRDVRAGVEGKFLLREIAGFGVPVLSFSGIWMHLRQPPLGLGVTIQDEDVDEPGNVGVFQTRLELPTANATVRIPLSFTYANRTEFLKESDVRGQIGITVNLDALFAEPGR